MAKHRPVPRHYSIRLKDRCYDRGTFAVTIRTQNWECFFGEVINGKMELNAMGCIAHNIWQEIPNNFEDTKLDSFVVMPNHIHGIIIIGNYWEYKSKPENINTINNRGGITGENNPMLSKNSLPKIIRWFKGRCTYEIRKMAQDKYFKWYTGYYEQVISSRDALNRVRQYIYNNPSNWKKDDLNPSLIDVNP